MAQTIYCDFEGCEAPADQLVSQLVTGDTTAWCNEHWAMVVLAIAQELNPEQAAPPAPAEPDQQPAQVPDRDDEDADDQEALRRLEAMGSTRTAAEAPEAEPPAPAPSEAPGPPGEALEPTQVVKRGTSRSRRAHEARKRQRAAEPEPEQPAS